MHYYRDANSQNGNTFVAAGKIQSVSTLLQPWGDLFITAEQHAGPVAVQAHRAPPVASGSLGVHSSEWSRDAGGKNPVLHIAFWGCDHRCYGPELPWNHTCMADVGNSVLQVAKHFDQAGIAESSTLIDKVKVFCNMASPSSNKVSDFALGGIIANAWNGQALQLLMICGVE